MKTINILLPSFGGFYESMWLNCDTEYYALQEFKDNLELDFDFKHLDDWGISDNFKRDVCKAYTECMCDKFRDLGLDVQLNYETMTSPSYYNFETDKVWADLTFDGRKLKHKLLALMRQHEEQLTILIERYHTSYDGFWSWMDNHYDEWYQRITQWDEHSDRFGLYVSYLLTYLVLCHNNFKSLHDLDEDIYMDISEWKGIYPEAYIEPQSDEAREEYDAYLAKVEYKRMLERDQMSINFPNE